MLSHEKVAITLTAYTASKNTQTQSTSEASDERYILLRRILRHRGARVHVCGIALPRPTCKKALLHWRT
jgi:hypothetical protein